MLDLEHLRKVGTCVYLAAEGSAADDIAKHIMDAADEIERLRQALKPFAQVGAVMDFYVPDAMPDMTFPRRECETKHNDEPRCVTLTESDFRKALAVCG